ncbi:A-kinase anchor protein 9 isoform X2 [Protopterus annectens]|uniref:A-kinase anchor protein 9 isoform X2 n=1 Tax=Protopterus annectens TaxID=7888 RepID=UPI001CFB3765|nr:A-kinase anchor protein 9 isoform X2 [Protopterus annectens]
MSKKRYVELKICQTISCTAPFPRRERQPSATGTMEDEERQKKLEAGKARLAEFRQRKAQADGQSPRKKPKKKKRASGKEDSEPVQDGADVDQSQGDESYAHSSHRGSGDSSAEFCLTRTLQRGDIIKHDQTYTIEQESEVSTTAEDFTSEEKDFNTLFENAGTTSGFFMEEEIDATESYSEHEAQRSVTEVNRMEEELTRQQQRIEELSQELQEARAICGTDQLQQLQEFETAIKQRDGIITQLTSNLQQSRREKDEIMKEFLELTEQSQKLQIQFQQLQASENLRKSSHSSANTDLLQAKRQILTYQQQLEEQEQLMKNYQRKCEEYQLQVNLLQDKLETHEAEHLDKENKLSDLMMQEKDALIDDLQNGIKVKESDIVQLQQKLLLTEKSIEELKQQLTEKTQEAEYLKSEVISSKQRERQSSDEVKQLMGTVEELQKRCHKGSQSEMAALQRVELESQRKLEELRAELDEMYGQQIVQMKQELRQQHTLEINNLITQHKVELERTLQISGDNLVNEDQLNLMNMAINELNVKLQETYLERDKVKQEVAQQLEKLYEEKSQLQIEKEDLFQDLKFTREQVQRMKQSIAEKEHRLSEVDKLQSTIEDLKAQLLSVDEATKDMESKHEAEVTNYKIKLEMLEKEKDAVLDLMAESQEAELERLRTQLLFSHEEELTRLKDNLEREHRLNIENLKDDLSIKHKDQLENVQADLRRKLEVVKCERDSLVNVKNQLISEISKLKEDLQHSMENSRNEEMAQQIKELHLEIETLRKKDEGKGTFEQEIQELKVTVESLTKQLKDKDDDLNRKAIEYELAISSLKDENKLLEEQLQSYSLAKVKEQTLGESGSESLGMHLQKQIEMLTAENDQLKQQEAALKNEVERQKNTFSFAEKNFEVNFHELQDEYACLLRDKEELAKRSSMQEGEYEAKLRALNEEIQQLKLGHQKMVGNMAVPETCKKHKAELGEGLESEEVIEKDTTEIMEKLETAQREKEELSQRLADLSEQIVLGQNKICELEEELKYVKQEKEELLAKYEEMERSFAEGEYKKNRQEKVLLHGRDSSILSCLNTEEGNTVISTEHAECEKTIRTLRENLISLETLVQDITLERDNLQQHQNKLLEEQEILKAKLQELSDKSASETLIAKLQLEKSEVQQQLDGLRTEQLGLAELIQRKAMLEESLNKKLHDTENALTTAEKEKLELENKLKLLEQKVVEFELFHEITEKEPVEQPGLKAVKQDSTVHMTVENSSGVFLKQDHKTADFPDVDLIKQHAEAERKLQMEAQRISLTQIYAAQLELVQEQLQDEKAAAMNDIREAHMQEVTNIHSTHQQALQDMKSQQPGIKEKTPHVLIKELRKMVLEESSVIVQSFASILKEGYMKSVDYPASEKMEEGGKSEDVCLTENEEQSREWQLQYTKLKALETDLHTLIHNMHEEYQRLAKLQTHLIEDSDKINKLQTAYTELQTSTEAEITNLHMQLDSLRNCPQEVLDLSGQLKERSYHSEELERLKVEMKLQRIQLEEQHIQKVESIQSCYEQQIKEAEQKHTTEIRKLSQRLQEVSGFTSKLRSPTEVQISMEEGACTDTSLEQQNTENLQSEEFTLEELNCSIKCSARLYQQLEILRRALYAKYHQELSSLKEEQKQELERLTANQREQHYAETEALRQEIAELKKQVEANVKRSFVSTHETHEIGDKEEITNIVQALEKQHQAVLEEEVAKVIVQMSVEIAQQKELMRISHQCQDGMHVETSDWQEADMGVRHNMFTGLMLPSKENKQEHERDFEEEIETLRRQLEEKTDEILLLKEDIFILRSAEQRSRTLVEESVIKPSLDLVKGDNRPLETLEEESEPSELEELGQQTERDVQEEGEATVKVEALSQVNFEPCDTILIGDLGLPSSTEHLSAKPRDIATESSSGFASHLKESNHGRPSEDIVEDIAEDSDGTLVKVAHKEMHRAGAFPPTELVYQERLEDMRQELVRQDQEHQQMVERLRHTHAQQLERQREEQDQLLTELEELKAQLAEHVAVVIEESVAEVERITSDDLQLVTMSSVNEREQKSLQKQDCTTQTELTPVETEGQEKSQDLSDSESATNEENIHDKPSKDALTRERDHLQKVNERLMKVLLEVVKTTAAAEETIGHHVIGLLGVPDKGLPHSRAAPWEMETEESMKTFAQHRHGVGAAVPSLIEENADSCHGSDTGGDDTSVWSAGTDEGLELSHRFTDGCLSGAELDAENEELVQNISTRLQSAVEKLLEAITEATNQVEHARITQTELLRESFSKQQELTELLKRQEELQERLNEETRAREHLALELHKAEGLIDGYSDERASLETQAQEKAELLRSLEQELNHTTMRLQELEEERQQLQIEKELVARQKAAMKENAGPVEYQLLEETEKLMKEKVEVQRQAEKEHCDLDKRVKDLEAEVEEQENRAEEQERERNTEIMDLRLQIQSLEKQLEKNKKFLEEQAIDREHERDVFQQEIQKLEQQLKLPQRQQPVNEQHNKEVEQLTNQLKEKTDKCNEYILAKEQLIRDVQERNEEIEKLECRVREVEQALLVSAENLQKVEERKHIITSDVKGALSLEAQLQAEREALDRRDKEITNLEEQLEQFREELENRNEEVQQLQMQLEVQRNEATSRIQALEQENKAMKDEVDNARSSAQETGDVSFESHHCDSVKHSQLIQEKDQVIEQLNEQITKLQQQLDIASDNKVIEEKNDLIKELEAQIECLKSDQERLKKDSQEEIEQLNEVIEKLQQELAKMDNTIPVDSLPAPDDAESLKHQLEIVMAEKEVINSCADERNRELIIVKDELEKAKLKVEELNQELEAVRTEHKILLENYRSSQMDGYSPVTEHELEDKTTELEEALREKTAALLVNQAQVVALEESAQVIIKRLEAKIEELELSVREKDMELNSCYTQMRNLKELSRTEPERLQEKVLDLTVNKAQIHFAHDSSKSKLSKKAESDFKKTVDELQKESINQAVSESHCRVVAVESQLLEMQKQLEMYKKEAEVTKKDAAEKEEKLRELKELLKKIQEAPEEQAVTDGETITNVNKCEKRKKSTVEVFSELESLHGGLAAAKEEVSDYREKTEKLQEELKMKEVAVEQLQNDLKNVKDELVQAELKLVQYLSKEQGVPLQNKTTADPEKQHNTSPKEKPQFVGKDSSSQTDRTNLITEGNQMPEIQSDADGENAIYSEDIRKVMESYIDKIEQMRELHAAEVMDMETRHISETEALKREHFVTVQTLKEKCSAMKTIIETLGSKQVIPVQGQSSTCLRDEYSSDASSDWSQGGSISSDATNQEFRTRSEEAKRDAELLHPSAEFLPDRIKNLLREVHQEGIQVLSLTEAPYGEEQIHSVMQTPETWSEERQALLNTIQALKELITKMKFAGDVEGTANSRVCSIPEWHSELLKAVQQVFLRERDVFVTAVHSLLSTLNSSDASVILNHLAHHLREQTTQYRSALDHLQSADRKSLLMEIQSLQDELSRQTVQTQSQLSAQEQQPQGNQAGLQELAVPEKQTSFPADIHQECSDGMKSGIEHQDQLSSEALMVVELKNELAQTKLEFETTLKAQHKLLKELETLRSELSVKTAEADAVNDKLVEEQKKGRELQWALEKENAKVERKEEREREELEDLKLLLEDQKQRCSQLSKHLDQEKQTVAELKQKVDSEAVVHDVQLSKQQSCISELQILLDAEKTRAVELNSALERERELYGQLQKNLGTQKTDDQQHDEKTTAEFLRDLQTRLDEKHNRIVELVSEMEKFKLESVQMKRLLDEESQLHKQNLQQEQEMNRGLREKLSEFQLKYEDLLRQLTEEKQRVLKLQLEEKRLQGAIEQLQNQKQKGDSRDISDLQPNMVSLDSSERTMKWVLQQETAMKQAKDTTKSSAPELNGGETITVEDKDSANVGHRLSLIYAKIKELARKASDRMPLDAGDNEEFVWLQNSIQDIASRLQQLPSIPLLAEHDLGQTTSGSSSSLTERLLRQNAELTGYVSKLTEEKNELRNIILKLEEELQHYRRRGPSGDHTFKRHIDNENTFEARLASEKEMWSREKITLQKSLKLAEAEAAKLRAELRSDAVQRDLNGSDSERIALKRIYGKYLRAESFRKALVYQKKYLLLLLGGFQECEEATLSLIAKISGQSPYSDLEIITHHSRAFTRFRSAVRVSIAISRMKYLVRRWQRAVGSSPGNINRNGFGQNTGIDVRTDSPILHAGGLDFYGERRHPSKSRSGVESPRSTVISQNRYHSGQSEQNSLTCSHLQSYDPDRALTDYISRLEALQRRLGSSYSGSSSSYAHLQHGIRR